MSTMKTAIGIFAVVLLASPASAQSRDAANGQKLFMAYGCYSCHGTQGSGSGDVGPKLAPEPVSLDAMRQEIRHPARAMPAYSEVVLKDSEISDIHAFLASIPKATPAAQIPLLNH